MTIPAPGTVLFFDDEAAMAGALAQALGVPAQRIERHRFPDGELKLRLPPKLPPHVVLLRTLHPPNERLLELLITAPAARELGAQRVSLVCPYLAYMRQDMAFTPGEAVSQRHVGALLASRFDALVTVDPHLHRIATLHEVMPACRAVSLSAAPLIGPWVARQVERPFFIGPDAESAPWVAAAARACRPAADHAVCTKERHGDREVQVTLPAGLRCEGRHVVLIDDMASTGRTLVAAAQLAFAAGAATVDVAVTHALFVDDAVHVLREAGVRHVWSSDSVPHTSNAVPLAPALAAALQG